MLLVGSFRKSESLNISFSGPATERVRLVTHVTNPPPDDSILDIGACGRFFVASSAHTQTQLRILIIMKQTDQSRLR